MIREIFFIIDENIKVIKDVPRILGNSAFDQFIETIYPNGNKQDFQPEIQKIIENSKEFQENKKFIKEKIEKDFKEAIKKVE